MTTKLPAESYLQVWEKAAEQEIGLELTCAPEDQLKLINALYECRQIVGGFEDMMLAQPLPPGTIFVMKQTVGEMPE